MKARQGTIIGFLALSGLILFAACAMLPGACAARQPILSAYASFRDLDTRAGATQRIALSPVVGEMQTARRAINEIQTSGCGQDIIEAHTRLREWMDADIQAYLAFLSSDSANDPLVQFFVDRATDKRALAHQQMERIAK